MKAIIILSFILPQIQLSAQKISPCVPEIDTINYVVRNDSNVLESNFPQIINGCDSIAIEKINEKIRNLFLVSDTMMENSRMGNAFKRGEELFERFTIEFNHEELLCISVYQDFYPKGGQLQQHYDSKCYELRTGKPLNIHDLFSFSKKELTKELRSSGYAVIQYNTSKGREKIDLGDDLLQELVNSLLNNYSVCIDFYLNKVERDVDLMIVFKCHGPQFHTYGIEIEELRDYIIHPALKKMIEQ